MVQSLLGPLCVLYFLEPLEVQLNLLTLELPLILEHLWVLLRLSVQLPLVLRYYLLVL